MRREIVVVVTVSERLLRLGLALALLAAPSADLSPAVTETQMVTYYPDPSGAFVKLTAREASALAKRTGDVILTVTNCANVFTSPQFTNTPPPCTRRAEVRGEPASAYDPDGYAAFYSQGHIRADALEWRGQWVTEWPAELGDQAFLVSGCKNSDWSTTQCRINRGASITITWNASNTNGVSAQYEFLISDNKGWTRNITKNPTPTCKTWPDPADPTNTKGTCTVTPASVETYKYALEIIKKRN